MTVDPVELTNRIYEAALLPDLWPSVLRDLAVYGEGHAGLLFTVVGGSQSYLSSPGVDDVLRAFVEEGWPSKNDRPQRILKAKRAGFITDLDVYTEAELEREPVYTEFLRPRGWGWAVGTAIPVPSGEVLYLTVERALSQGPAGQEVVRRLDPLRPHLARAALLSARLGLERIQATADALDAVGVPAVVIGARHQAIMANRQSASLFGSTVKDGRRLAFVDPAADRLLVEACEHLKWDDARAVRSIPVVGTEGREPMIAHVVPFRRTALDLFSAATAVIVFTLVNAKGVPAASILEGLFDLTPAEAKVARDIAERRTIEEIAGASGLSRETVRTQLKSVFAKTGTSRQAELVSLLSVSDVSGPF